MILFKSSAQITFRGIHCEDNENIVNLYFAMQLLQFLLLLRIVYLGVGAARYVAEEGKDGDEYEHDYEKVG